MSNRDQDQVRSLAERIARQLASTEKQGGAPRGPQSGAAGDDLEALRAGLSEIQRRLAHIESHIAHDSSCASEARGATSERKTSGATDHEPNGQPPGETVTRSPWLSGTYVPATSHPSQERFAGIGDAVSELVEYFEREKICGVEPGAKPCDQCGMCSSRGF